MQNQAKCGDDHEIIILKRLAFSCPQYQEMHPRRSVWLRYEGIRLRCGHRYLMLKNMEAGIAYVGWDCQRICIIE